MDEKLFEVLMEELRLLRSDVKELRGDLYGELKDTKKDISSLKTRFMLVAVTMGLAGGKVSAIIPFFK